MKEEGKPHQEKVKGDIFHCRTKVPFMRQSGGEHRSTLREEKMWLSPTIRSPSFPDLKINKRQVQQHSGRHTTKTCAS